MSFPGITFLRSEAGSKNAADHSQRDFVWFDCPNIGFCGYSAFLGQAFTHSMHKMHSVPLSRFRELSVMSTFMGHACLHFPQEMHFSLSQVTLSREKQLRNPSICIFSWERAPRYSSKDGTYLRILLLLLIVFTPEQHLFARQTGSY